VAGKQDACLAKFRKRKASPRNAASCQRTAKRKVVCSAAPISTRCTHARSLLTRPNAGERRCRCTWRASHSPPPVAGMGVAGSVQGIGESDSSQWMMWIRLAVNNKFLGWPRVGCLTHQATRRLLVARPSVLQNRQKSGRQGPPRARARPPD
jgi:hypothetical protein